VADIETQMHFLSTEAGGRKSPAYSGYRPQFFYNNRDWDAEHEYPEVKVVRPGETVKALVRFFAPHEHLGKVHVGMPFLIREGSKTVAYGTVTEILDLEASAARSLRDA
jgi:translation elongation factor EF-Tu-like GTPase